MSRFSESITEGNRSGVGREVLFGESYLNRRERTALSDAIAELSYAPQRKQFGHHAW
jgi:hypothetical protein